jgi:hypothetical protein
MIRRFNGKVLKTYAGAAARLEKMRSVIGTATCFVVAQDNGFVPVVIFDERRVNHLAVLISNGIWVVN